MRIEIVEIVDPAGAAGRQSWRAEISRLHDDQDCLGHQRPTAGQKSHTFADAEALEYRKELAAPDRDAPTVVAGVHVDGDDAAERRLEQRDAAMQPAVVGGDSKAHFLSPRASPGIP